MSDLISRQAAIDAILSRTNCKSVRDLYEYTAEKELHMMWTGGIVDAIDMVIGVPSAQSITCGDCTHYKRHDKRCGYWNHGVNLLDWCSYAERKQQEIADRHRFTPSKAEHDTCETCKHESLTFDQEPCESCTPANSGWKQKEDSEDGDTPD